MRKSPMGRTGNPAQDWKDTWGSPRARARARARGWGMGPLRCWRWGVGLETGGPISSEFA